MLHFAGEFQFRDSDAAMGYLAWRLPRSRAVLEWPYRFADATDRAARNRSASVRFFGSFGPPRLKKQASDSSRESGNTSRLPNDSMFLSIQGSGFISKTAKVSPISTAFRDSGQMRMNLREEPRRAVGLRA